ncbi:CocE/NonD family hydrolase [Parasphingorhabdus sp.]|uniref:CocE/NonD family hydrolase n=1 Tax=Parasphingorhabdus sp. TaxID=2709688 RepID=UPI0030012640
MNFLRHRLAGNPFFRLVATVAAALALSFASLAPLLAASAAAPATEQAAPATFASEDYAGEDVMIPMRDGVRLHAQIWRPAPSDAELPIIMMRSPYGFSKERIADALQQGGSYGYLAADGYIFVFQDIRGRFSSEGEYVTLRPRKSTAGGIDESTDTYDSIDWLVRNLPENNGKAAVMGVSYGGWTAAMATIDPHPALKAVSSQASPEDMFIGDDFAHNGAFRLDYAWSWVTALESDGKTMKPFQFGSEDGYDWYLRQSDLATLDEQHLGRKVPSWQNFVEHKDYDDYWKRSRPSHMMPAKVAVPNLIVAGWYDQEDFYGPLEIYKNQEKGDEDGLNYLVVGPWNHGGWRGEGASYGPFELGSATGTYFRSEVELPWFQYWLKGEGTLDQPEALVFETGSNQWQRLASWPIREKAVSRNLYLRSGGKLSFEPPQAGEAPAATFVSDPANPVPYRERSDIKPFMTKGSTWSTWLADDQSSFASRNDVLFWESDPLPADVTISGDVAAKLFASTTGNDADWVVKLLDVYPADEQTPAELRGRQRMIANDVFRGRYYKSYENPEPLEPGAVLGYDIDLHYASHVFKKGHRIAVQVQSSWFPLINRNPQTWVPNILQAKAADYKVQTHSIYHTPDNASAISVTVAESAN